MNNFAAAPPLRWPDYRTAASRLENLPLADHSLSLDPPFAQLAIQIAANLQPRHFALPQVHGMRLSPPIGYARPQLGSLPLWSARPGLASDAYRIAGSRSSAALPPPLGRKTADSARLA